MAGNSRFTERIQEEPLEVLPQLLFPPTASFTVTKLGGNLIQTHSTSTDPDGTLVQHQWTWGDEQPNPTAAFSTSISGLVVTITNASSAVLPATITSAIWDYGDGSTGASLAASHTHTYQTGGSYDITLTITDSNGRVSTPVKHTVSLSTGTGTVGTGRPWGPSGPVFGSGGAPVSYPDVTGPYSMYTTADSPGSIVQRIQWCRDHDKYQLLTLVGGAHSQYMTNGVFDFSKYKAQLDRFTVAPYKGAIQDGIDEGIIPGVEIMDEPHIQSGSKSWGPTMSRKILDDITDYYHTIWPNLPCGCWMPWNPDLAVDTPAKFSKMDWQAESYLVRKGSIDAWKTEGLAYGVSNNLVILLGINVLNGGFKPADDPLAVGCPQPYTGGPGAIGPDGEPTLCAMTAAQFETFGKICVQGGAATPIWRYDQSYFSRPETIAAAKEIAKIASPLSRPKWSNRL